MSKVETVRSFAAPTLRLARVVGVIAIMASAVAAEYGAGINFVAVQSLGVYPGVHDLVPWAMFLTGILLLPKTYLYMVFSRVMPCAGSKYVWITRSLGVPAGFMITFVYWVTAPASMGVLGFAFGTFLGRAIGPISPALSAAILTSPGHMVCGLAAIWVTYLVNISGVHRYATFVTVLLGLIVAVAIVICAYGFSTTSTAFVAAASKATGVHLAPPTVAPPDSVFDFVSTCALFIFAYGGLGSGPSLGGEARDAKRKLPRGIFLGWLIALVLFTAVAAALFHAAPWWAVTGLIAAHKSAYATAPGLIGLLAPGWVTIFLNLAVALIVGKTMAPILMVGSRFLFAFGQDGMVSDRFASTSSRQVPVGALTLIAVMGTCFLIQSTYVGWALGVAARSLTVILAWMGMAVSILYLKWHPTKRRLPWAAALTQQRMAVPAAIASIVFGVPLLASLAIAPHTRFIFQPLFQIVLAAVLGFIVLGYARRKASARGDSFDAMALRLPVE